MTNEGAKLWLCFIVMMFILTCFYSSYWLWGIILGLLVGLVKFM